MLRNRCARAVKPLPIIENATPLPKVICFVLYVATMASVTMLIADLHLESAVAPPHRVVQRFHPGSAGRPFDVWYPGVHKAGGSTFRVSANVGMLSYQLPGFPQEPHIVCRRHPLAHGVRFTDLGRLIRYLSKSSFVHQYTIGSPGMALKAPALNSNRPTCASTAARFRFVLSLSRELSLGRVGCIRNARHVGGASPYGTRSSPRQRLRPEYPRRLPDPHPRGIARSPYVFRRRSRSPGTGSRTSSRAW